MYSLDEIRPVWLEINMDNLEDNFKSIREIVNGNTMIMPVIKANGYGHGSLELAKMYTKIGAERIAVSVLTEAIELRKAGIECPLQVLNYTSNGQMSKILDYDIIQSIYRYKDAEDLSAAAVKKDKTAKIHIKIDSGMNRVGFIVNEDSIEEIMKIAALPNIEIEGIFTHFAKADEFNKEFTKIQYEKFQWIVNKLEKKGILIKVKHISNSAAIIDLKEYNLDMVRPGIMLYGYYPSEEVDKQKIKLNPAMTLKARISNIKTLPTNVGISYGHAFTTERVSVIGTIPIGYADGFSRMLSGKAYVSVNGTRVPIVGRICMDQMMIDITDIADVGIGDEVVLFGAGDESYPKVEEVAAQLGTINYELICMMGRRIPRVYLKNNEVIKIVDYLID